MQLVNCWEHRKCGRERSCPAYPNHGRNCFAVTGTWCRGEEQGTYEAKIDKCRELCRFYEELMGGPPWEATGTFG
ncbi:MAG: two-CW domain-containing protein [Thermodesulfobacteriota bacterium]